MVTPKIHKETCAGQGGRNRAGLGRTAVQEMQARAKNRWEGDEWGHGEECQGVGGRTWVVCTSSARRVVHARLKQLASLGALLGAAHCLGGKRQQYRSHGRQCWGAAGGVGRAAVWLEWFLSGAAVAQGAILSPDGRAALPRPPPPPGWPQPGAPCLLESVPPASRPWHPPCGRPAAR